MLSGDPAGVVVYVLVKDKSRSMVGGSPRGGREERLWDMSISAIEKKTSSSNRESQIVKSYLLIKKNQNFISNRNVFLNPET